MKSTSQSLDQSIVDRLCVLSGLLMGLEVTSWNEILDLTCSPCSPELELPQQILLAFYQSAGFTQFRDQLITSIV